MRLFKRVIFVAILAAWCSLSAANVRYSFSGLGLVFGDILPTSTSGADLVANAPVIEYKPMSFVFESDDFITSTSSFIDPSGLQECDAGAGLCLGVQFLVNSIIEPGHSVVDQGIVFYYSFSGKALGSFSSSDGTHFLGPADFFYFSPGDFAKAGLYETPGELNHATLSVMVVPELASFSQMLIGLFFVSIVTKLRRSSGTRC